MNVANMTALRRSVTSAVESLSDAPLTAAVEILARVRRSGGIVLTAGNGGSSSTASHFAADLVKYTRASGERHFRALALADNIACHTAWANDDVPSLALAHLAEPWLPSAPDAADAVVVFSVHGGARDGSVSDNLSHLAALARKSGASVIAVTGFDGGAVGDLSDVHLNVNLRHEPLATPGVESVHLLIAHALCLALSDKEIS